MTRTALIADDEATLRHHLDRLLADYWSELEIVARVSDGEAAWRELSEKRPDVAFLDIRMPGCSGLEVAARAQRAGLSDQCAVVFLTAYDEYAVQAFEHEAVDYLLKPIDEGRLQQARDRLVRRWQHAGSRSTADPDTLQRVLARLESAETGQALNWLTVSRGESIYVIAVADVLYFRAEDKYTTVVTGESSYLLRKSLRQLEDSLPGDQFWRIHRSTLVQASAIARVEKTLTGQLRVHLKDCTKSLPVSRRFSERFRPM